MDWAPLIRQFQPLDVADVPLFAPPRDMGPAIAAYNRAVFNIGNDSSDMALIALRKLVATYPQFALATLLLGYCLADTGQLAEARQAISQAILAELPDSLQFQAERSLLEIDRRLEKEAEAQNISRGLPISLPGRALWNKNKANNRRRGRGTPTVRRVARPQPAVPTGAILERSGRRARVRVAGERERKSFIRQGEHSGHDTERISSGGNLVGNLVDILRLLLPILAGGLVIGLLVYGGITFIPRWVEQGQARRQAPERLDWLLAQLSRTAGGNAAIDQILQDYEALFNPAPTPTTADETSATTVQATQPTATGGATQAMTTHTTTAGSSTAATTMMATISQAQALQQASQFYQDAIAIKDSDLMAAADKLLSARHLLATVPGGTTASGVVGTASSLSQQVESQIGSMADSAAFRFWTAGKEQFDSASYPEARSLLLKAYELNPRSYGGGAAYYCGRCYQILGDPATAKIYYDDVVTNFAGSDIAASAAARLVEMGY